ncbi:MAG: hypothetical protein WB523_18895 [Candidatus Sulfotelmatobacter sp.]
MAIVIQPYREKHQAAVADFNRRLQAAGAAPDLVFYGSAEPQWLSPAKSSSLYNEFFVALDNGVVRGCYALKHQDLWFAGGKTLSVAYYHHPLSEGIVNKSYAVVGSLLLRDAMQRASLLYCLGMGGYDRPLPRMLVGLGWSHYLLPFYFRVVHPNRFLREMNGLRTSPLRRLAMDIGAFTGAGWLALKAHQGFSGIKSPRAANVTVEEIPEFREWADSLWEQNKKSFAMTAVRDYANLRLLYSAPQTHLTKLRIRRDGKDIGWAVAGERRKDPKFGALRVGSIVDCWASPEDCLPVVRAAAHNLEEKRVDLIVSNQSHQSWCAAFESAGFMTTESTFIFAASKPLAALLQPFDETKYRIHFTRADGDGLPQNF